MNLRALLCLALIHTLVDGSATLVAPLWPRLQKDLALDPGSVAVLFAFWQIATSVSQPVFGCWSDRFGGRWLVGLGPALAIVCLSLIGWAGNGVVLGMLLILGGIGIGAFHPEAAVHVVEAAGTRTNNGLALFVFGGMVGLGLGPLVSGNVAEQFGLHHLVWVMPPGLLLLGTLLVMNPPARHAAPDAGTGLTEALRGRWGSAGLLLAVGTLRAVPVLGIPLALAFWLKQQGFSEADIGLAQSLFLLAGGVGTLLCPLCFRPGREVAGLTWMTVPAAAFVALLTWSHPVGYYAGLIGSGFLLQGTIPLLIGYSQRLLPRGRRLAASLTLGTSWGLAGLIVAGLQDYFGRTGQFEVLLWALVPFTLLAALGAWLLPGEPAPDDLSVHSAPALASSPPAGR